MEIWELHKSFLRGKLPSETPQLFSPLCAGSLREDRSPPPPTLRVTVRRERGGGEEKERSQIPGKCILFAQRAVLSKRRQKTEACCYETYRMWRRRGRVESSSGSFIAAVSHRQRMQKALGLCGHVGANAFVRDQTFHDRKTLRVEEQEDAFLSLQTILD